MKRAWKVTQLSVELEQKFANVILTDGAVTVTAHFRFDAPGDAKESTVRAAALREAMKLWGEAEKADVQ